MHDSNASKMLDSQFYESDVAYTGTSSKNGKRGLGTDKQPFLIVLATQQENQYPSYIKIKETDKDTGMIIKNFFEQEDSLTLAKQVSTCYVGAVVGFALGNLAGNLTTAAIGAVIGASVSWIFKMLYCHWVRN